MGGARAELGADEPGRRSFSTSVAKAAAAVLAVVLLSANFAFVAANVDIDAAAADTAPAPGVPETVSAASLPTVQINGVVWNQVIVGNRVFATGQFTRARPAGSAPGTNEVVRSNILAYDLTTGVLIADWAPSLNAQGLELAASADGSRIFVGGDFDQVNGQWRSRIAALDTQTGALLPFNPGANSRVDALAVAGNTLYYGGNFTNIGTNDVGIVARTRFAAVNATTGERLSWAPTADSPVNSMVYAAGRVVVSGGFSFLNGVEQWSMGSFDADTGALRPWAANTVIRNHGPDAAIGALSTDGDTVFGTGWAYFAGGANANFEGVFGADAATGAIKWIDAGRGDNYDVNVNGDVVYSVGHPHDWGMIEWNPQYPEPWQFQRATAINKHASPTLTNAYGTPSTWLFEGTPAAQPLHWLPTLTGGTYTGQGQAAWSVESNGNYTVLGGEFPRVNGVNQQGLVRFAKRAVSPTVDPIPNYPELQPTVTPVGPGTVRVGWKAAWDRDNERLTVEVLRGATTASSTVLKTFQTSTNWWTRPPLGFVDKTAPPGSSQTYRIRVTDPYGNGFAGPPTTATIPAGTPSATPYADEVLADSPSNYWRMGEASGTTARDFGGSNDSTLNTSVGRDVPGALLSESDPASNFPGTSSTSTVQGVAPYWGQGPHNFSMEAWVRTSTTTGGKILGFGDSNTGRSGSNGADRHLYMNNAGRIYFGVRPDMGTRVTINSPNTYRDNAWHHVAATLGSDGMKLYIDGTVVAINAGVTKGQVYRGYWRIGGDRLSSWPSTPAREAITANIDEVAVYPKALTAGRIQAHYLASGRNGTFPNVDPNASFTTTPNFLGAAFDGSESNDPDGTITSYQWNFGDGTFDSGPTVDHTYAAAGTYNVTLTVTDNRGATDTFSDDYEAIDPPPNVPPTASFSWSNQFLSATLNGTGSTDGDGTIESYEWDFGDGTSGTGATVVHPYATANTYTVTLTVTDDDGDADSFTDDVTVTDPPPELALDSFTRDVTNGLGTAEVGGPWTLSAAASGYSVAGGVGRINGALSANRAAYLQAVAQTNVDITTDVALSAAPNGGGAYVYVIGRRVSNGNDYRVKLRYMGNGTLVAYLVRTVGGVETTLATANVPGITVGAGDQLRIRFQVNGTGTATLRTKVWRVGSAEPGGWLATTTDGTAGLQGPGGLGYLLYVSGTWAGAVPVLTVDNLSVVVP